MSNYNFVTELAVGHSWATFVANYLNDHGIGCEVTRMQIAETESDIEQFSREEKDIVLTSLNGHIEVKSRKLQFTNNTDSYPYETSFIDTQSGWAMKESKPLAVVLVSQITSEMLVVPVSTEALWGTQQAFDATRGFTDTFLTIHKSLLQPMENLVQYLLHLQRSKA